MLSVALHAFSCFGLLCMLSVALHILGCFACFGLLCMLSVALHILGRFACFQLLCMFWVALHAFSCFACFQLPCTLLALARSLCCHCHQSHAAVEHMLASISHDEWDCGAMARGQGEKPPSISCLARSASCAVAFHASLLPDSRVTTSHCRHWTGGFRQHKCATSSDLLGHHLLHEVHGTPGDPPQPGLPSPLDCADTPPLPAEPLI